MSTPSAPSSRPRTLSTRARWAVPAVVAVGVAAAFAAPPLLATADDDLQPPADPAELIATVLAAEPTPLSGTVVYTARLGLPELPISEMTGADPINLLSGSSTLRLWTDGADRSRVSLLGTASEYSVVRDGPEAWTYSSADDESVHYSLDAAGLAAYQAAEQQMTDALDPTVTGDLPTPQEAATQILERASEHSTVTLGESVRIAGQAAHQLVITPDDAGTLVAKVVVAVDARTSVPLRVQAWGVSDGSAPSLELGFTDVSYAAPADAVLTYSAPAGATTREVVVPLPEHTDAPAVGTTTGLPEGVAVAGEGWSTIVTASDVDVAGLLAGDPTSNPAGRTLEKSFGSDSAQDLIGEFMPSDEDGGHSMELDTTALYDQLTTAVPEGRLLSSTLLSILVTDDGRVLVGSVPADALRAAA
ncbi:LolA family protein [Cellulomonas soli]|uniref:LolA family protein n=1 Tax=Cellulomonas soli TaxID=931535 RepID=UPI003F864238